MGVSQLINVQGSVTLGPVLPCGTAFPSVQSTIDLALQQTRQLGRTESMTINVNSPSFASLVAGLTFSAIRFVALRVQSGILTLRVTTPAGAQQLFTVSELIVLSNPQAGSEITALDAQGVANVELIIAGDP